MKVFRRRRNTEIDFESLTKHFDDVRTSSSNGGTDGGSIMAWLLANNKDCDKLTQVQGSLLSDTLKLFSILGLYICIRKLETCIKWITRAQDISDNFYFIYYIYIYNICNIYDICSLRVFTLNNNNFQLCDPN